MKYTKSTILILVLLNIVFAQKKFIKYPITDSDRQYIEEIRAKYLNLPKSNPKYKTYNITAYHDKNAGQIKLFSDEYLDIELDVLPLPYIGKYFKKIYSIKEFARFYNVWEDSIHIQEEKRGIYFYKILPDNSVKLLKYYGNTWNRKRREGRIYPGNDIISLINKKLNGEMFNRINTYFFGYKYLGQVFDYGDSISIDPTKFFVVLRKGVVPIIDDKKILLKDTHLKFDENGYFTEGKGIIRKGFDTEVTIKEIVE